MASKTPTQCLSCYNFYDRRSCKPLHLPCTHDICKTCAWVDYKKSNLEGVKCPYCRKVAKKHPDDLKTAFKLMPLVPVGESQGDGGRKNKFAELDFKQQPQSVFPMTLNREPIDVVVLSRSSSTSSRSASYSMCAKILCEGNGGEALPCPTLLVLCGDGKTLLVCQEDGRDRGRIKLDMKEPKKRRGERSALNRRSQDENRPVESARTTRRSLDLQEVSSARRQRDKDGKPVMEDIKIVAVTVWEQQLMGRPHWRLLLSDTNNGCVWLASLSGQPISVTKPTAFSQSKFGGGVSGCCVLHGDRAAVCDRVEAVVKIVSLPDLGLLSTVTHNLVTRPVSVTATSTELFICNSEDNTSVLKFSLKDNSLLSKSRQKLRYPKKIINAGKFIFVSDLNKVTQMTPGGEAVAAMGAQEWGSGELTMTDPKGLAIFKGLNKENILVIADSGNKRLKFYTDRRTQDDLVDHLTQKK